MVETWILLLYQFAHLIVPQGGMLSSEHFTATIFEVKFQAFVKGNLNLLENLCQ